MSAHVKVGCCGFGMGQSKYFERFSTVEVQQTFYQPPKIATLEKWRENAPEGFEFSLKAWQLITHQSSSPTYRRLKKELSLSEKEDVGFFKPTSIVLDAWKVSMECADALRSNEILFQCPASFEPTKEHLENMYEFFDAIEKPKNIKMYWEPRGENWTQKIVAQVCDELNLIHAVDPFVTTAATKRDAYFRMHGRTGWRYEFSDEDLVALANLLPKNKNSFVYFNNVRMIEDAIRFKMLLAQS